MMRLKRTPEARLKPKALKALSDADLVELAQAGKREAFGELYERYAEKIYSYIYFRTSNHHDAEDLTARVFSGMAVPDRAQSGRQLAPRSGPAARDPAGRIHRQQPQIRRAGTAGRGQRGA
jgi:hypothetical protein